MILEFGIPEWEPEVLAGQAPWNEAAGESGSMALTQGSRRHPRSAMNQPHAGQPKGRAPSCPERKAESLRR